MLIVSLDSLPWSAGISSAGHTSAKLSLAQQTLLKVQQHIMEPQQHQWSGGEITTDLKKGMCRGQNAS